VEAVTNPNSPARLELLFGNWIEGGQCTKIVVRGSNAVIELVILRGKKGLSFKDRGSHKGVLRGSQVQSEKGIGGLARSGDGKKKATGGFEGRRVDREAPLGQARDSRGEKKGSLGSVAPGK